MSERTEAPTPRRLRRAHEDGDVAVSAALTQATALLVVAALVPAAVTATAARAASRLRAAVDVGATPDVTGAAMDVLVACAPVLLAGAVAAAAAGWVQTGGVLAAQRLAPRLERLDPVRGLTGLVSLPRLFSLVRALVAAAIVALLAERLLVGEARSVAHVLGDPSAGAALAAHLAARLLWWTAALGLGLAVIDFAIVRHAWWRRLHMTRDEVRRDHRESEGDPELKAARRRQHQALLTQSIVAAVREATVVVVNPTHLATALRYGADDEGAPLVVAQGAGELARQVIAAAHAYGVPVIRDVPVAHALAELELGDEIPEALYEAVAEILRAAWAEQPPAPASGEPPPLERDPAVTPGSAAAPYPRMRG